MSSKKESTIKIIMKTGVSYFFQNKRSIQSDKKRKQISINNYAKDLGDIECKATFPTKNEEKLCRKGVEMAWLNSQKEK